jgi:DNA-binding MarR family transcriptional regulator
VEKNDWIKKFGHMNTEVHKKTEEYLLKGIELSISMPHIFLLSFIKEKGISSVSDIAHYLGVTLSAVTCLVDKLVDMNLVDRKRSEKDRRLVLLEITQEGDEILEKVKENSNNLFEKCFKGISRDKIEIFFEVYRQINENLLLGDE